MNCRKCGSKCRRRKAGEFYCRVHGDMPKPIPAQPLKLMGPFPNVVLTRPLKAKGAV